MALTLNQAAKACGRSKSTLLNAIRSGRMSAPKNDRGLEREIELLREMLVKAETNADHWRGLAERQQALLEDKRPKKSYGLFRRFLGRL